MQAEDPISSSKKAICKSSEKRAYLTWHSYKNMLRDDKIPIGRNKIILNIDQASLRIAG